MCCHGEETDSLRAGGGGGQRGSDYRGAAMLDPSRSSFRGSDGTGRGDHGLMCPGDQRIYSTSVLVRGPGLHWGDWSAGRACTGGTGELIWDTKLIELSSD